MFLMHSGKFLQKLLTIALIIVAAVTVYEYVFLKDIAENLVEKGSESESYSDVQLFFDKQRLLKHNITVDKYYEKRKNWVTSNLGAILFKNSLPPNGRNRTFYVLVWKYFEWLRNRHEKSFNHGREDPLDECSVKNCIFTGDDTLFWSADAVLVHIQHGDIPNVKVRNPNQRWVFLSDESPRHAFSMSTVKPELSNWHYIFNWSMTYRSDADVPVPYGRTLPLESPLMSNISAETIAEFVPYWKYKRRDVLVTVLMSNCAVSARMKYLKGLQKHINVTIYGRCSEDNKMSCPGHFTEDCKVTSEYLFYLVLENSQCRQYITEKSFNNAYAKGAIPIIMGPPLEDCEKLLPPNSFLHVDNFDSPAALAKEIKRISRSDDSLLSYHLWRNDFKVVNEHGYFGSKSFHYCRLCEALNYNSEKSYSYSLLDLELFLDTKLLCRD